VKASLQASAQLAEFAIKAWEVHVKAPPQLRYKMPKFVKQVFPQRFVTLFLYLNSQTKIGGETVFPFYRISNEKFVREGIDECSNRLAVTQLASLFYVQIPEGEVHLMSHHGGCPPHEGPSGAPTPLCGTLMPTREQREMLPQE
jgi:hypothetical protein